MKHLSIVMLTLLLVGCGVRVDTPDPSPEAPSSTEVVRQRVALHTEVLTQVDFSGASVVSSHAGTQLEALGGVWQAWPDGDGPTDAPGRDVADIAVPTNPAQLADVLERTTTGLVEAAINATDIENSTLYASIAVARTADESTLRLTLGEDIAPQWPDHVVTAIPSVIRALDAAAYGLEVLAAVDSTSVSESTAQADAERFRRWANESVLALGVAGTADDPREPLYDIDSLDRGEIYADAAAALVAATAPNTDRASVIAAAQASAAQAAILGATVGALPGILALD